MCYALVLWFTQGSVNILLFVFWDLQLSDCPISSFGFLWVVLILFKMLTVSDS